jgi:hypothetical protein
MPQWKNTNDAGNSVNYVAKILTSGNSKATQAANNTALFNNATPGAFEQGAKIVSGQVGVEVAAMANTTGESSHVTHPGWTLRTAGMGPLVGAVGAGSGYTNGAVVTFTSTTNATINTTGVVTTNTTGGITLISVAPSATTGQSNNGSGLFVNTSTITSSNPNGAINALAIVLNGTGYNTGDVINITGSGAVKASFVITSNATYNVHAVTMISSGTKFGINSATTKTVTSASGAATGNGVVSVAIGTAPAGGLGYNATDIVNFSNATISSTANLAIAANGAITTFAVVNPGSGFTGITNTVISVLTVGGLRTGNGVVSIAVSAPAGTGYANGDTVGLSNSTVGALGTVVTGASNTSIASITMTANGSGFNGTTNAVVTWTTANVVLTNTAAITITFSSANIVPTFAPASFSTTADTGTFANVVPTLGGRAGRVFYETLVAMGSMGVGAGSNTAYLPE